MSKQEKKGSYIEISSSTNIRQSVRQVRDQTVIFFCIYICKSSSLPAGWQYVIDVEREREEISNRTLVFFFYTRLLMLFDTLARAIWSFDQWSFCRFFLLLLLPSLQTNAASIVFLLDIYIHNFSLWLSHILLTFLSLNLVKRTLIELSTEIEYCSIWKRKAKLSEWIRLMSMSIIHFFFSRSLFNWKNNNNKSFFIKLHFILFSLVDDGDFFFSSSAYLPMCSWLKETRERRRKACMPMSTDRISFRLERWSWQ